MTTNPWGPHSQAAVEKAFESVEGLPNDPHTPEHFFIEEIDREVDGEIKNELYPIPRTLYGINLGNHSFLTEASDGERHSNEQYRDDYHLMENGALVSTLAQVGDDVELGSRTEVEARVSITNSNVGDRVKIERDAIVSDSLIEDHVQIDPSVLIKGSTIHKQSWIGALSQVINSCIRSGVSIEKQAEVVDSDIGEGASIGRNSKLKESRLRRLASLGDGSKLDHVDASVAVSIGNAADIANAVLESKVVIENGVHIEARKRQTTVLGSGSKAMSKVRIRGGRKFKPGTAIVPRDIPKADKREISALGWRIKKSEKPAKQNA